MHLKPPGAGAQRGEKAGVKRAGHFSCFPGNLNYTQALYRDIREIKDDTQPLELKSLCGTKEPQRSDL